MARILIIEDSPINMKLTVAVLQSAGHAPLQAENANEGIDIARREKPHLILLDIVLPDMDGTDAARILKADPQTRQIPIIAVSALAMKGDRERILEAGCNRYIEKPIRYREFLDEVEAVLSGSRTGPHPAP